MHAHRTDQQVQRCVDRKEQSMHAW
jgi:hypothetical protein